jgi:hypothetical protein
MLIGLQYLYPQEKEREALKALVEFDNASIVENKPFTITILVNHPQPAEITVEPPDFNEEFYFEKLRSSLHITNNGRKPASQISGNNNEDESSKWTELQITLIPVKQGTFTLNSWMISSPDAMITTLPLHITVSPSEDAVLPPRFAWSSAQSIRMNEDSFVTLRITGWNQTPLPRDLPLHVQTPKNAIVEAHAIPPEEAARGAVLYLRVQPLAGTELSFHPVTFRYQNWVLVVPELKLKVLPSASQTSEPGLLPASNPKLNMKITAAAKRQRVLTFPVVPDFPGLLTLVDGDRFQQTLDAARAAWQNGDYAAALAALRAGERDFAAGASFAYMRKNAEAALGLNLMTGEIWSPGRLFIATGLLSLSVMILLCGRFIYQKVAHVDRHRLMVKSFAAAGIATVLSGIMYTGGIVRQGKSAVLRSTKVYDVPEQEKESSFFFEEGTPVRIKAATTDWLYAEATNGSSGWVPRSSAAEY